MTALRTTVILGLVAALALSPKLWLDSRLYPLTPVWPFLKPLPPPFDSILYFTLIALLLAFIVVPRRAIAIPLFAIVAVLALQDQSRWQPWFYQYVVMLAGVALAGRFGEKDARGACRLIVAATYFWSGLAKLNPDFESTIFLSLFQPLVRPTASPLIHLLAIAAAIFETAIGVGLLTRRFRRPAAFGGMVMHLFILLSIGPLGSRFNVVVWPWNLAMIAFLWILFLSPPKEPLWENRFGFHTVVAVLFGILPLFSFFGLWDQYLSCQLYSGNRNSGTFYFDDSVFERLPDRLQDSVTDEGPNRGGLDINEWSLDELNVASYPELRIYQSVARRFCRDAHEASSIELVFQEKYTWIGGHRRTVYRCRDFEPR